MKLIPYIRRSRRDEEVVSLEDQRKAIQQWAERNGTELLPFVEEPLGTSGAVYWRDRQVGDILQRLGSGEADGIAVAYFSRLSRGKYSETFELLEELQPYLRVSAKTGRVKQPGEDIDVIDVIETWQARDEYKTLGRHLASGKHESWLQGVQAGPAPAGYDSPQVQQGGKLRRQPLVVDPEDAPAIRRAFELRAAGHTWTAVARHLTDSGVRTYIAKRDGIARPWTTQATRALITNGIYRGQWNCNCGCGGSEVRSDLAIVTRTLWESAQPAEREVTDRRELPARGKAVLSGILRCGSCGGKMRMHHRGGSYTCDNQFCDRKAAIRRDKIEEYVVTAALDYWAETEPHRGEVADPQALVKLEAERDAAAEEVAAFLLNVPAASPGYREALTARQAVLDEATVAVEREEAKRNRERIDTDAARSAALTALADEQADEDRAELRRVISRVLASAVVEPHGSRSRKDIKPVEDRVALDFKAVAF